MRVYLDMHVFLTEGNPLKINLHVWFILLLSLGVSYTYMDPHGYRPRFHIRKLTQMRVDHVKDLQICHRSTMDLRRSATVSQGQVRGWPFDCFFNPQTLSVSIRSNFLSNICWHGGVTDERDSTRTSRCLR